MLLKFIDYDKLKVCYYFIKGIFLILEIKSMIMELGIIYYKEEYIRSVFGIVLGFFYDIGFMILIFIIFFRYIKRDFMEEGV